MSNMGWLHVSLVLLVVQVALGAGVQRASAEWEGQSLVSVTPLNEEERWDINY